jgi:hypothetical protein
MAFMVNQIFFRWELYPMPAAMLPQAWLDLAALVRGKLAQCAATRRSMLDIVHQCGIRNISPRTVLMMRRAGLQPAVVLHCMCANAASCAKSDTCVCRRANRKCSAHCHPVSMICGNCDATVKAYDTLGFHLPTAPKVSHKKGVFWCCAVVARVLFDSTVLARCFQEGCS